MLEIQIIFSRKASPPDPPITFLNQIQHCDHTTYLLQYIYVRKKYLWVFFRNL